MNVDLTVWDFNPEVALEVDGDNVEKKDNKEDTNRRLFMEEANVVNYFEVADKPNEQTTEISKYGKQSSLAERKKELKSSLDLAKKYKDLLQEAVREAEGNDDYYVQEEEFEIG